MILELYALYYLQDVFNDIEHRQKIVSHCFLNAESKSQGSYER